MPSKRLCAFASTVIKSKPGVTEPSEGPEGWGSIALVGYRLWLPGIANKDTEYPIKFEFQINSK